MTVPADGIDFEGFVAVAEPRIRRALVAALGWHTGNDATAEALAYGWEHWPRIKTMDNPTGYLYVVGRDRGRRVNADGPVGLPTPAPTSPPWIEPGLPGALAELTEHQRVAVMLVHCFQWTLSEVAALLDVTKATVQTHHDRGMTQLRSRMGAT